MDGAEDVIIYNCMCVNKTNHKVTKNNDNSRKSMNLALPASVAGRECAHAQKRDERTHLLGRWCPRGFELQTNVLLPLF